MIDKKWFVRIRSFNSVALILIIIEACLFWFSFLLHLFLREMAYEFSFETHNAFVFIWNTYPFLVLVYLMLPCWILLFFMNWRSYYWRKYKP